MKKFYLYTSTTHEQLTIKKSMNTIQYIYIICTGYIYNA